MKLGLNTLGCPQWTFDTILARAQEYGFQGIEFRGVLGEMDLLAVPEFQLSRRAETRRKAEDADVEIVMLNTGCKYTSPDPVERRANVESAKANMDLAREMGSGMIRVYGGRIPAEVNEQDAYGWVAEGLRAVAEYGQTVGVLAAIETHDGFVDTGLVKDMLARVDHPYLKVLWDVHHPWRQFGQTPRQCWDNFGEHVVETHLKDSYLTDEVDKGFKYCFLGDGDVPVIDALRLLHAAGYDGYLTLEWEKAWQDYLPDPSEGFPQYVKQIKQYLAEIT